LRLADSFQQRLLVRDELKAMPVVSSAIPACVLVMNKNKPDALRGKVLFINERSTSFVIGDIPGSRYFILMGLCVSQRDGI
jgi:hypothetical protein